MGFDGLELRDDEEPEAQKAEGKEENGLKEEREEFSKQVFVHGKESAPIPSRRQNFFSFFLSVEKSQCLRGQNEGWT